MERLYSILDELESFIPFYEKVNAKVSLSSIGWQLDHSLLVINGVISQLRKADPQTYRWQFKWIRTYIQITNTIPRGKVRVPKSVRPTEVATPETLLTQLALARTNVADLQLLHRNAYFTHPFFGNLNRKPAIWFLELHTNHHLKIIRDILNKA